MSKENEPVPPAASDVVSTEASKELSLPDPEPAEVPRTGSSPLQATVSRPFMLGLFITLGGLTALGFAFTLGRISTILMYVALAIFIALGLDPLVRWLQRRGLKRPLGIGLVYATFLLLVTGLTLLISPVVVQQLTSFIGSIPQIITDFQTSDAFLWVTENYGDQASDALATVSGFVSDPQNLLALTGGALQVGIGIGNVLSGALIVLVLSLYFLASLETMKSWLVRLLPAYERRQTASLVEQICHSVGDYLGGMTILALMNSILVGLLSMILGLAFPPLMAVTAFFITLIPLIGTVLFWGIGTVVALFHSPTDALVFAIVYFIYMQLEAYLLTPKIMNRSVAVPGALVVIGALVGGTLLGLLGALVAVPITASIILIVKQVLIPKQDAKTAAP
ncbi:AI-2E family transporter [Glutamicibacter sp. MNS18]|uniref:AI-2E family transporter n=1 Tax=Glutamicibacter sp. MNS18 TaxID=2989817 RepID=UPI0022365461|nr:AI-2E family transporter [Glutamicibacter sp. MNS18]MCW4465644.1 AI-2E family transporter [Glutamicibacter sp. MNS18]